MTLWLRVALRAISVGCLQLSSLQISFCVHLQVKFGADEIFRGEGSAITDQDVDAILAASEVRRLCGVAEGTSGSKDNAGTAQLW